MSIDTTIVVPSVGRPTLDLLLHGLRQQPGIGDVTVIVVDDRPEPSPPLRTCSGLRMSIYLSGGRGPAAARNVGWRAATTTWVSFVDDDVRLPPTWLSNLRRDLDGLDNNFAGSQGRLHVPLPSDRRPTDWERNTKSLESAHWITADLTYRRADLKAVAGFDERFPRAYREDAELALRLLERGRLISTGERHALHPVRSDVGYWQSVRAQKGNADDALMRSLHGRRWRERCAAGPGRRGRHLATTAAAATALAMGTVGRGQSAAIAGGLWGLLTLEFAASRVRRGPRCRSEIFKMLVTSIVIPPVAVFYTARGMLEHRHARPLRGLPSLVLFDRDGTIIEDVPYNNDPGRVRPASGARQSLDRLRAMGIPIGVISNQSGVASGQITDEQLDAVNVEVERRLGEFAVWRLCRHGHDDGCACRKPRPGMVLTACAELGVPPGDCVVVGDIASDVKAAEQAGARAILVPTAETRTDEVSQAPTVAPDLVTAVDLIEAGRW
ncbi:MAG: HAD-IIIA family hydrolase [Actinomycetes bacterium]